jgi:purine nucleosidase
MADTAGTATVSGNRGAFRVLCRAEGTVVNQQRAANYALEVRAMPARVPILLDTDIGSDIDDAVCLAYLLAEPRCELVGITTVTGQPVERAMLADAVCRAAGRDDVPVFSGCPEPILYRQRQPKAPQAEVLPRWDHRCDFAPCEAVEFLRRTIRERPGEITLLTIGPLTNVGLLFAQDPDTPVMLRALVMMGGYFFEGRSEWNTAGDPIASQIVFSAAVPKLTAYGLDVTTKCTMASAECRRRFRGGPLDVVHDMAEVWYRDRDRITFHDPLAAASTFEPGLCTYRQGRVTVELARGEHFGDTLFGQEAAGPHVVAEKVDRRPLRPLPRRARGAQRAAGARAPGARARA